MAGNGRCSAAFYESMALRADACPLSLAALASSPKGGALGMAGKFPVELQSLRARSLPPRGSCRAATEGL